MISRKTLNVAGMSCDHCKMAVSRAVGSIKGVSAVEVSLENNTASFDFDEAEGSLDSIIAAIEDQGYEVVA
jgi:copper chaperone